MLPPLHPTTRSTSMPSRSSTRQRPSAAAHLTAPEPITTATRLRRGTAGDAGGLGSIKASKSGGTAGWGGVRLRRASTGVAGDGGVHVGVEAQDAGEAGELEHLVD